MEESVACLRDQSEISLSSDFQSARKPSLQSLAVHAVNATLRRLLLLHLLFNFCKLRLQNVKEWLQVMLCIVCTNGDGI